LFGAEGNDTLMGGLGDDALFGDSGRDSLFGGAGNDFIEVGIGDRAVGGAGEDFFSFAVFGRGTSSVDFRWGEDSYGYGDLPAGTRVTAIGKVLVFSNPDEGILFSVVSSADPFGSYSYTIEGWLVG
jgi:Ca2+-binding RTX toxin-like protein